MVSRTRIKGDSERAQAVRDFAPLKEKVHVQQGVPVGVPAGVSAGVPAGVLAGVLAAAGVLANSSEQF